MLLVVITAPDSLVHLEFVRRHFPRLIVFVCVVAAVLVDTFTITFVSKKCLLCRDTCAHTKSIHTPTVWFDRSLFGPN